MKKISVIIPAHNCEKTINQCVESITSNEVEIIIIENNSTDNSVKLIKEMAENNSNIIFLQTDSGPSKARNIGIDYASGEYIIFLDSDDFIIEDLDKLYNLLSDKNDIYFMHNKILNTKNEIKDTYYSLENDMLINVNGKNAHRKLFNEYFISTGPCNYIYKSSFLKELKAKFDEKIYLGEDTCFVTKCLWNAKKVSFLKNKVICFRQSESGTLSSSFNEESLKNICKSFEFGVNYSKDFTKEEKNIFLCPYINSALWFLIQMKNSNKSEFINSKNELQFLSSFLMSGYKMRHKVIGILAKLIGVFNTSKLIGLIKR